MTCDLVGTAEIAALLGVSRQRADQLTKMDDAFPRPVAELVNGRIWAREAVVVWAVLRGRVRDRGVLDARHVEGESPATGVSGVPEGRAALAAEADGWRVGLAVPEDLAEVLRVSRELFVHSYFVYEFSLVAIIWALFALEAGLRGCVSASGKLDALINLAKKRALISAEEAEALHGAQQVRNKVIHGQLLPSFKPDSAAQMLQAIHEAISDLYERVESGDP
jgi:hypothetical protein